MHDKMSVMTNYGWHYNTLHLLLIFPRIFRRRDDGISPVCRAVGGIALPKAKVGGQSQSSSLPDETKLKVYYHGNSSESNTAVVPLYVALTYP